MINAPPSHRITKREQPQRDARQPSRFSSSRAALRRSSSAASIVESHPIPMQTWPRTSKNLPGLSLRPLDVLRRLHAIRFTDARASQRFSSATATFVLSPASAGARSVARYCSNTPFVLRSSLEQAKHDQRQPDQYGYRGLRKRVAVKRKKEKARLVAPWRGLQLELQACHLCPRHHRADGQHEHDAASNRKRPRLRNQRVRPSHDHKRHKNRQPVGHHVDSQPARLQLTVHHKLNYSASWADRNSSIKECIDPARACACYGRDSAERIPPKGKDHDVESKRERKQPQPFMPADAERQIARARR